jgi:ankyrin repeat protein
MTSNDNAPDRELLERYRRASGTETAAPSEAVRAAILAEGRRVAELRAKEARGQPLDASRPAANDSRWKITAFGTAGAALVAALLFAPRLWENMPPAPAVGNATVAAPRPKAESMPASPHASEPLQEIVVTQSMRKNPRAADAASPKLSAAAPSPPQAPPERQLAEALAQPAAPAEKIHQQNYVQAAPQAAPSDAANAPAVPPGPVLSHLSTARAAGSRNTPPPAALLSAAASGDTGQTTTLLDQGAALEARDELGRTPLMLAVMQRKPEVVRLLLDRGADPNVADSAGRTPLQRAKQENLREIAALLERAGAR